MALEPFARNRPEVVRDCGPACDIAAIEKAVLERVGALPPERRRAVISGVEMLTFFEPPGFHQGVTH